MGELLIKLFIKNSAETNDPSVRESYGVLSGVVGIILNLVLFAGKLFAGLITSSIAIIADAFNNLSDAGSSIITIIGFKMAGHPADSGHPFGHGRIEYIAGFIISIVIMLMGFELFQAALVKIRNPEEISISLISLVIMIAAVVVKLWMAYFNRQLAARTDSATMRATALDSLSDSISTTVVLVGIGISYYAGIIIDGYLGVLVSLFIFYAGFSAAKDTLSPLLGQPPDRELVQRIQEIVMAPALVSGIHELVVHDYGPGRLMISLHAEVPCDRDILELHDTIDCIEMELCQKLNCVATIHMDPIAVNDPLTMDLRKRVADLAISLDPALKIHDLRLVPGPTHTNIIFDIVVPAAFYLNSAEVIQHMQAAIKELDPSYYAVIQVDQSYV